MKLWERVIETRIKDTVLICRQQFGFMPRKSTTDAIVALRVLMDKYSEGGQELHLVFVDLEKTYDRVPMEEQWRCIRKAGITKKHVRVARDMYKDVRQQSGQQQV